MCNALIKKIVFNHFVDLSRSVILSLSRSQVMKQVYYFADVKLLGWKYAVSFVNTVLMANSLFYREMRRCRNVARTLQCA